MGSMRGKSLIEAVFRHERCDTVPWVPFAGVHAGKLKGYTAREVSTDGDKLVESLIEVNRLYRPDGQPVMFDLQLEPEALGCELLWAEDAPPSVVSHPLDSTSHVPAHVPADFTPAAGRFPMVLDAMRRMKSRVGETTALYGLFCGPFTLASHLRGTDIFMDMIDDPDYVHRLIDFTTDIAITVARWYADAGMDVLASVDPLVSQISPDHFAEFLTQPCTRLFAEIRKLGRFSSFFVCGNATRNIEEMCKTGPDGISIDENIDLPSAKKVTDRYNIMIGGNIPLTTVMLFGTQQDNMKCVVDIIENVDTTNLTISPGCDMPYAVPIENSIAIEQAVHETEKVREMIRNYEHVDEEIPVELPDYASLEKPLVEVFTLDSATCAACTYMYQSAMDAKRTYGVGIDVVEYKYTTRENIARMKKMGIANLPSIYVNGELRFSSIIPSREELNAAIDEAMAAIA